MLPLLTLQNPVKTFTLATTNQTQIQQENHYYLVSNSSNLQYDQMVNRRRP